MATTEKKTDSKGKPEVSSIKPLQTIPYSEKTPEWRKQNIEYFINNSMYKTGVTTSQTNQSKVQSYYNAYNNIFDEASLAYVTNPLNVAKDSIYSQFPARLRWLNILRPTADLLIGEWSKRPFKFDVLNLDGEGVMNSLLETKYSTFSKNITQRFVAEIQAQAGEQVDQKDIPNPQTVIEDLNTNYKDLVAIKGYKALKLLEFELKLKEKYKDWFKDWIIAGDVSSLKNVKRSDIEYERLSPIWSDGDKSVNTKNYEDGSYRTAKFRVTVADFVDMFYEDLKEADLISLEQDESQYRRGLYLNFSSSISSEGEKSAESVNKIDLYYVCWKSRYKVGFLSYNDPFTGEPLTAQVDENYPVDKAAGETIEWMWLNQVWEGWRANDDLYLGIKPCPVQRNEGNNFSSCKLPINGRKFSDTEAENVSVFSLGMNYQLMYVIINYRIELTIAQSKGKILIYDKNTISDDQKEQDKTFYYAFALGFLGLDRAADDVDRTWTRYEVVDMSLFEHITQLIKIAQWYKDSWEELMGISRQRKGDITASDGLGTTQEATFRSSVISDIIFSTFDEWVESELQGLLDLSKFAWIEGKKGYYRNDDGRMELFAIDPEDHQNADMGVFVDSQFRNASKLELMKAQVSAASQRKDIKLSTIADMVYTDSYAELKAKLKEAEVIEAEIIKAQAESEQQAQINLEAMRKDYMMYENQLKLELQERDWDRKDNNEFIKGEIAGRTAANPVDIDMGALQAESNARLAQLEKSSIDRQKLNLAEKKLKQDDQHAKMKDETDRAKIAASLKNKVSGEK